LLFGFIVRPPCRDNEVFFFRRSTIRSAFLEHAVAESMNPRRGLRSRDVHAEQGRDDLIENAR
jgi:hypothetical protein